MVKVGFAEGMYLFEIAANARKYYSGGVNQRDMYIQLEATPRQCPAKPRTGYGLMFRYIDDSNYYLLTIFCDKTYTIGGMENGSIFGNRVTLPGILDPTRSTIHHVGILAQGDDYTLYFDKQSIGTFQDARHQKGDVGIYAMSQDSETIRVSFGNLKVWTIN